MELHNLKPAEGSVKKSKRVGRGQGSGKGGTSARGEKGARSRSGYKNKWGFEGGQTPLQRRLPKRGFKNVNRVDYVPVNLDFLQYLAEKHNTSKMDMENLSAFGLIGWTDKVKILGRGEITVKVDVQAHKVSEKAKAAIEAAGGSVTLV